MQDWVVLPLGRFQIVTEVRSDCNLEAKRFLSLLRRKWTKSFTISIVFPSLLSILCWPIPYWSHHHHTMPKRVKIKYTNKFTAIIAQNS